jgi:hypothetical protein
MSKCFVLVTVHVLVHDVAGVGRDSITGFESQGTGIKFLKTEEKRENKHSLSFCHLSFWNV